MNRIVRSPAEPDNGWQCADGKRGIGHSVAGCVTHTGAESLLFIDLLLGTSVIEDPRSHGRSLHTGEFVGYRSPVRQFSSAWEKGRARVFFFNVGRGGASIRPPRPAPLRRRARAPRGSTSLPRARNTFACDARRAR